MGPPDTTEPGERRGLTPRLQPYRKPPGHPQAGPQLSQASQEAHAGHGRRAGTRGWRHSQVTHLGGSTLWLCAELERILPPTAGTSISQVLTSDARVRAGREDQGNCCLAP